ncbi:MAG TPA: EAL domain-containing protein [Ilumatobacteraceae bacterium]
MSDAHGRAQQPDDSDRAMVLRALSGGLHSAYQPIVALDRNLVVGYEALLRADMSVATSPQPFSASRFLETASRVGLGYEAEAEALRAALSVRDDIPRDCFLSLNVSLASLNDDRVTRVLRAERNLEGVVLEVKTTGAEVLDELRDSIALCRDRGALIAVADPSLHAASLEQMMLLEPGYLKLDRNLVGGVSESNTKLALVDSIRHLAERLRVGVIAEGIEDLADLRSLERIGIGFGQGFLLARPSTNRRFTTAVSRPDVAEDRTGAADAPLRALIEAVCELTESDLDLVLPTSGSGIEFEVLVTELREPMALLQRVGRRIESLSLTIVDEDASLQQAARIAMRRGTLTRFHPVVCVDALGACVGVVRIDRLIDALAATSEAPGNQPRAQAGAKADVFGNHRTRFAFDFSCRPPKRR